MRGSTTKAGVQSVGTPRRHAFAHNHHDPAPAHSERLLPLSQFRRPSLRISLRTPRNARKSSELEDGFQPSLRHAPGPREQYTFSTQLQRSARARLAHAQSRHLNRATFQPSVFDALASSFFPFLPLCLARSNNSPCNTLSVDMKANTSLQPVSQLNHNRRSQVEIACPVINTRRSTFQHSTHGLGIMVPRGELYRRRC